MAEQEARHAAAEQSPDVVTPTLLREWPLPDPRGTKDAKGRLVVVGGSVSTPGAVLLAAEAAMRVGAGKVQVATTSRTAVALAIAVPEAFVLGLDEDDAGDIAAGAAERLLELCDGADAVLLGPGIGAPEAASALLEAAVPRLDVPVVIDALGTAYLTEHRDGLRHLADRALLTPNGTELSKVLGEEPADVEDDMLGAARRACAATGATVLSGSDVSYVVAPDGRAWCLEAGAPGAAAAGSGDVKAGTVAGLLARGATPAQAAAWGAYLHGRAAERLTASVGRVGFLARELVAQLPRVLAEVEA